MKGWTKRRLILILALVLIVSQMTGCRNKDDRTEPEGNKVVFEETESKPDKDEAEESIAASVGWLEENLENIHQSLLTGDYARAVELLLEMQDELANNAQYNALLYIAYMGNGDESAAEALLRNPNLDTKEFTDAFLDHINNLKDNEDMAAIERSLMEHMMRLGETNPRAYDAVAQIGLNIQNDNPSDPTAYAARYLAALAAGDEAAARAILAEAEANGISAEALKTTAIRYLEENNLTNVSVDEIEKGKTTSTTYNSGGNVVKTEETVDNKDGTKTKFVKNSDDSLIGEALYSTSSGKLIRKIHYGISRNVDETTGKITETLTGGKEIYEYQNGVIRSMTGYHGDGSKDYHVDLSSKGEVVSAYGYSGEEKKPYTQEMLDILSFEIQDGDLVSKVLPVLDEDDNVTGKNETTYSYDNPMGLPTEIIQYVYGEGKVFHKLKAINITYTFEEEVKAYYKTVASLNYNNGMMYNEYHFTYDKNDVVKGTLLQYDKESGEYLSTAVIDFINHTQQTTFADGNFWDIVLDESNTRHLTADIYRGDSTEGLLLQKNFYYYEGEKRIKEVHFVYDEKGNVTGEFYFEHVDENGTLIKSTESKRIGYIYDDENRLIEEIRVLYDAAGSTIESLVLEYDNLGNISYKKVDDPINHTQKINAKGEFWDIVLDESNTVWLTIAIYQGDNAEGVLLQRGIYNYEDTKRISEQRLYYDTVGNITKEVLCEHLGEDGTVISERPSKIINYTYDQENILKEKTETSYHADGDLLENILLQYDDHGEIIYKNVIDYINHTRKIWMNGELTDIVLDETNVYYLSASFYDKDGVLYEKDFYYYDGTKQTSELRVIYDEFGNITTEYYYEYVGEDGVVLKNKPSKIITYIYDAENSLEEKRQVEYNLEGDTLQSILLRYDALGNVSYKKAVDHVNHTMQLYSDGQFRDIVLDESNEYYLSEDIYEGDSTEGLLIAKCFYHYEGAAKISEKYVFYDEAGNVTRELYYEHIDEDGVLNTDVPSKAIVNVYEDNQLTQSEEATYDEDGNPLKSEMLEYDSFGEVCGRDVINYIAHTQQIWADGKFKDIVLDESNELCLSADIYEGDSADGLLTAKYYYEYEGTNQISELRAAYDENGNVIGEVYYEHVGTDGVLNTSMPSKTIDYIYDTAGNVTTSVQSEFDSLGNIEKDTLIEYDSLGNITYKGVQDYVNHTMLEEGYDEYLGADVRKESLLDESNTYLLMQTVCLQDGTLYARYFAYYEGAVQVGELDVFYDENGRPWMEDIYDNGEIIPGLPNKAVTYTYDDVNHTMTKEVIDWDTFEMTSETTYYDADGKILSIDYCDAAYNFTTETYLYDEEGRLTGKVLTDSFDTEMVFEQTEYTYGDESMTVVIKDGTGSVISTELTRYTYGANGEVISETVYRVGDDGAETEKNVTEYSYDADGMMIGYTVRENDTVTYYTYEGYQYQAGI